MRNVPIVKPSTICTDCKMIRFYTLDKRGQIETIECIKKCGPDLSILVLLNFSIESHNKQYVTTIYDETFPNYTKHIPLGLHISSEYMIWQLCTQPHLLSYHLLCITGTLS